MAPNHVKPKDVCGCGYREGVWLTEARLVLGIATALRNGLVELAATKRAVAGKNEAVEVLFAYLTGPEFRQRVEAIVRTFSDMQTDLEEEKRVAVRRWAKREKQIARVAENTSGMYGDLQAQMRDLGSLRARGCCLRSAWGRGGPSRRPPPRRLPGRGDSSFVAREALK